MKKLIASLLLLFALQCSAQLTKEEKKIIQNINKEIPQTLKMLEQLININSGDMVIYTALKALNKTGLLKNTSITAYFTGDEEKSGSPVSVSRGDFIARAQQAQVALAFEGAWGLHTVADARRGASGWQLN